MAGLEIDLHECYNAQNEKVGDIKELMLDKNGRVNTSATTPSPTDPSTASETGNTKGIPSRGTNVRPGTTGSGANEPTPSSNMRESQEKNASPASPAAGAEKEK